MVKRSMTMKRHDIKEADGKTVAILNQNKHSVYLVPSALCTKWLEELEEYHLMQKVKERIDYHDDELVEVLLDAL